MWENVKSGNCGIDFITRFDTENFKVKLAAEVKDLNVEDFISRQEVRKLDNFTQFAIIGALQAYEDAKFAEINKERFGVILSSGIGGLETIESNHEKLVDKGPDRVSPHFIPMVLTNLAAGNVAITLGAKGICLSVVTACAASTDAIGTAFKYIQNGDLDAAAAGGAEASITPLGIAGFSVMKAVTESTDPKRASIPFDAERNGFVMGEGAGVVILESLDHALARGAKIYGELVGYGATCDAHHITAPDPTGDGAIRAMNMAINDAGILPEDIDYINAHGTSTPLNDKTEVAAVKEVFKESADKLAMSSTKSMTQDIYWVLPVLLRQ
jgi:3-oxoacyl-[acyl-carrier-protein] synthase II